MSFATVASAEIRAPILPEHAGILTEEAMAFLVRLVRHFRPAIKDCMAVREVRHREYAKGESLGFDVNTASVRNTQWTVAPIPPDLLARGIELTGPPERKTLINGLNAPVQCFMADFEDALSPTWEALLDGQVNLRDAVQGTIQYAAEPGAKIYQLGPQLSTLLVRPRSWHCREKHVYVDGESVPAALFDFALYFYHNVRALKAKGTGAYFYLPKLESHGEAKLWADIFAEAEDDFGVARGSIRATVLIETLPAAFEMHEILHALKDHAVALNFGRWNYLASSIKCQHHQMTKCMPERAYLGLQQSALRAMALLLCQTSHQRGALAIGGMSPQIPVRNDELAQHDAIRDLCEDKRIEREMGYDGTWIAHPDLANEVSEIINKYSEIKDTIKVEWQETLAAETLCEVPEGDVSEAGLRQCLSVLLQYLEAWISGRGCVPLYNLMEDAATVEVCRIQIWHWIHAPTAELTDGRAITSELLRELLAEEIQNIAAELGAERFSNGRFKQAEALFLDLCDADEVVEFLTLPAYELLD